jgi:hypothetical protein
MNDLLSLDMDWNEGADEAGALVWNGDAWSLADIPVASAAQPYEIVTGLDSEGCSLPQNGFDLRASSNVIVFAQRACAGRLIEAVAA